MREMNRCSTADTVSYLATLGIGRHVPEEHDLGFSIRSEIIHYGQFRTAIQKIALRHRRWRTARTAVGMFLSGHSGTGKTTLLRFYESNFPRKEDAEGPTIPVLYVGTPSRPTIKNLSQAILDEIGDNVPRGSAEDKTKHICALFERCGVEVLIIDEFQHFVEYGNKREARLASDWLKKLMDDTKVCVILGGLPNGVSVIRDNIQLARRFSAQHEVRRFDWRNRDDCKEFASILKHMHSRIPVPCVPLHAPEFANRMYIASAGILDYVAKLIDGAMSVAFRQRRKQIDMEAFGEAFSEEVWSEGPKILNPFNPRAKLRDLVEPGEPFAVLRDDVEKYVPKN
ncbi:TniB family NTP-binding protein [Burkholderia cenocepacia]|uniref:TniB family NTP-binding protein n=1 Tax=Burkholderia territorii TaxID=1503055 RepID=UPI0009C02C86|nr:TniB family NTP-binding protein [Burkholderia territorii]